TAPVLMQTNTLSLHDALPISQSATTWYWQNRPPRTRVRAAGHPTGLAGGGLERCSGRALGPAGRRYWPPECPPSRARSVPPGKRSEEHTSELQSRFDLVCRLL